MNKINNIQKALDFGKTELINHKVKDAQLSAELLLAEVSGLSRQSLYSHFDDNLNEESQQTYLQFIQRRLNLEPLQYILGYTYFRSLKIEVGAGVLIPRPETELLVQLALDALKNKQAGELKILELCTGSGCIACALANEQKFVKIVATDISSEALKYAKKNISNYDTAKNIELVQCNMADKVFENDFDLIISNPPYVPTQVYETLDLQVLNFEPKMALVAGDDGLLYIDSIIEVAKEKLKTDGFIALELHEDSIEEARQKFLDAGFNDVKTYKDLAGKLRILIINS